MFVIPLKLTAHIPNFLTCLNLFCGCLALVFVFNGEPAVASYLLFIAMLFDFADGLVARALKVMSPIGKELDSLADMVSFGVVPGCMLYMMMDGSLAELDITAFNGAYLLFLRFFPFLVVICSALRLAKFNIDTRQHHSFIGLPTPAATLLVISFPLILKDDQFHVGYLLQQPLVIVIICAAIAYLLISPIPLFALKFQTFSWQDNYIKYIFLVCSIGLFAFFLFTAIPMIVVLYILLSLAENLFLKAKLR